MKNIDKIRQATNRRRQAEFDTAWFDKTRGPGIQIRREYTKYRKVPVKGRRRRLCCICKAQAFIKAVKCGKLDAGIAYCPNHLKEMESAYEWE